MVLVLLVASEAAWRAWRRTPAGTPAARLERLLLLLLAVTIAGGLGLLAGGARPTDLLHFVYAVVALAAVPVAISLAIRWEPRRQAIAWVVGALVALAVIARLFQTG